MENRPRRFVNFASSSSFESDDFGNSSLDSDLSELDDFEDDEPENDFLTSEDEDFGDMHVEDVEPTEFSESLHLSDLAGDEPSEMIQEVRPSLRDENVNMGVSTATAIGLGALGVVSLASRKFKNMLEEDDDDDYMEDTANAFIKIEDSSNSQSSSGNVAGAAQV